MKKIKLFTLIGSIGIGQLFLSSCNTSLEVMKRQHNPGYYISLSKDKKVDNNEVITSKEVKNKKVEKVVSAENTESKTNTAWTATKPNNSADILTASVNKEAVVINKIKEVSFVTHNETTAKPVTIPAMRKELKNKILKAAVESDINTLLLVIIAILLPPLAVFLVDGMGGPFLLSIILWLLFILPGIIYALYRVLR